MFPRAGRAGDRLACVATEKLIWTLARHKKLQWQVQVATGLWLTSPPPSGGKLKTILRWRTDNFIHTLSYLQLYYCSSRRAGQNCKLYSFTICIFIWTDFDLGWVSAHLRVDPRSKGYRTPSWHVYLCYLLGISQYLTLNVRMSGVTSPLLCCFAPSDHLHFFSCGQSTVHPHRPPPLTRPRYPWTSFLSLLVSSSSPHYGETHNEIRKITGSIF